MGITNMSVNKHAFLRRKLLVSMLIVPAIPFLIVIVIGYYYYTGSLEAEFISKINRMVDDHSNLIESFVDERKSDLVLISELYNYDEITAQGRIDFVFDSIIRKSDAFTDIGVFDENGVHVAYHGPYELVGKKYNEATWFRSVMEKGYYISDVFLGYRGIPHLVVAVLKREPHRNWVIRATIDSSVFSRVVERIQFGKTGEAYILNREGRFQTQRRSGGELMEPDPDFDTKPAIHEGVRVFVSEVLSGTEYFYATSWLENNQWMLVARQEKAEAYRDLLRVIYLVLLVALLGGALITAMAFYVTHMIIKRLDLLDSEKSELGRQLIRAGRLAEIGEMSSGFAHEINNPLQIIRAEETLIEAILGDLSESGRLEESEDTRQIRDSLDQIKIQIARCAEITQGILKFARKKEVSDSSEVDLNLFLPELIGLVRRKANVEGITIDQDIPNDIPRLKADPAQLQQVVVNLLNNAIDAIVEKHGAQGGNISVRGIPEDGSVCIEVRDDGPGIRKEHLDKIFTPFFTTKPVGKGTGLGLSICYGIVAKMDGNMEVSSEEGQGARFRIHLPAA
jgi:two-component system NtrC family sensor kinase